MRKQRNIHAVQFSVLACNPPAWHIIWSRLGVQSRWHGKAQCSGPLHSTDGINRMQENRQCPCGLRSKTGRFPETATGGRATIL